MNDDPAKVEATAMEKAQTGPDMAAPEDTVPARAFEDLPPAAQRALKEAEARREAIERANDTPREIGGRGGKDPARFGDWEVKGIAIDF